MNALAIALKLLPSLLLAVEEVVATIKALSADGTPEEKAAAHAAIENSATRIAAIARHQLGE